MDSPHATRDSQEEGGDEAFLKKHHAHAPHEEQQQQDEDTTCRCVKPLVVGIAGASRSGKTTLALGLLGALGGPTPAPTTDAPLFLTHDPRTIIHLDRYFKPPREMKRKRVGTRMVANWEVVSSLQWDEFLAALRRQIERKTLVCARCAAAQQSSLLSSASFPSTSSSSSTSTSTSLSSALSSPARSTNTPKGRQRSSSTSSAPISPRRDSYSRPSTSAPSSPSLSRASATVEERPPVKRTIIIAEGFLLFNHKEALSLVDKHIFITIDRNLSRQRRLKTMGTPGWYFDRVIWPWYMKNNRGVLSMTQQLLIVDGHGLKHDAVRTAADFIEGRPVDDSLHRAHLQLVMQEAQPPALLGWF